MSESGAPELFPPDDSASLRRGRIRYFPVVPGRLEFAQAVREEILREPPRIVAVELAVTLAGAFQSAAGRLPEISLIAYDSDDSGEAVYLTVEPADPFAEAVRAAHEVSAEQVFLDPDIQERPHVEGRWPDSYAMRRLGLRRYVEAYRVHPQPRSRELAALAEGVAWKLQGCDPEASILAVVSLNVLDPLLDAMERPQTQPMRKARRSGVRVLNLHPESLAEVAGEIPFFQAAYESKRSGQIPAPRSRARTVRARRGFAVIEPPKRDARHRALAEAAQGDLDRQHCHFLMLRAAEQSYGGKTGETIAHWQRRIWARFSRNLALMEHQLLPGLFDLVVSARAAVDDNFAWEFWETASFYPWQRAEAAIPTVKIDANQMWDGTRKLRLRRRTPSPKAQAKPAGLRGRKRESFPGEWRASWSPESICSYPPEDLVIENYGGFLKKKGKSILSEERSRVEPFASSLLDGIDLRETLRNWHDGRKIYVRENQRVTGEVGAVVVIFDEDPEDRYSYRITWLGEHQNESDMAFYATNPFDNIVGPGIGRAEYGGLLLSLPSGRLMDVWSDPDYDFAASKPERLLLAALDYAVEKIVVYAAASPPRSLFRTLASRLGRKIVYIPIGQLSPVALKKIRVMHVLDGHAKRAIAKDYIW